MQHADAIKRELLALEEQYWNAIKSRDPADVHMRQVSDDVVALAYKVREDLVVDGQMIKLEAFDSSVWARRGDKWVCVVHTESPAGDPFGRH